MHSVFLTFSPVPVLDSPQFFPGFSWVLPRCCSASTTCLENVATIGQQQLHTAERGISSINRVRFVGLKWQNSRAHCTCTHVRLTSDLMGCASICKTHRPLLEGLDPLCITMRKLHQVDPALLPFVRLFYVQPSVYCWWGASGTCRDVRSSGWRCAGPRAFLAGPVWWACRQERPARFPGLGDCHPARGPGLQSPAACWGAWADCPWVPRPGSRCLDVTTACADLLLAVKKATGSEDGLTLGGIMPTPRRESREFTWACFFR